MRKGGTPTHTFNLGIDTSLIKEVKITYSQDGKVILTKKSSDCQIEEGKVVTKLSQEDTFLFDGSKFVNIQLRVLTLEGDVLPSEIFTRSVAECLDDEVLT